MRRIAGDLRTLKISFASCVLTLSPRELLHYPRVCLRGYEVDLGEESGVFGGEYLNLSPISYYQIHQRGVLPRGTQRR